MPASGARGIRGSPGVFLLLVVSLLSGGCGLGYYAQAVWGGARILASRRPLEAVIADEETPAQLREELRAVAAMREFASAELHLPDNASYRRFARVPGPYVVWNVVATPELSMGPVRWCFPVAGCVSYRGYFSEERAQQFARGLAGEGLDTAVVGATAYSTLGWFADPVLSTFLGRPEEDLAALLFHELAHQVAYAKGDTVFNESFATAVEEEGVRRWLDARGESRRLPAWREARARRARFRELILTARDRLAELYASGAPDRAKRRRKEEVFADLRKDYWELRDAWKGYAGYDSFFAQQLNNAHLASVGAYHQLVPAFHSLLASLGGDLQTFYAEVRLLAELPVAERRAELEEELEVISATR